VDDDVPDATANDLDLRLRWSADEKGSLYGELHARNVCNHFVRVGGKPVLQPIGQDGAPLEVEHVITAEYRVPPHVDLSPGQRAVAPVNWAGWAGPPASDRMRVEWVNGIAELTVEGPTQPRRTGEPRNLSSSWFNLVPDT
jgi:hypothetical protein